MFNSLSRTSIVVSSGLILAAAHSSAATITGVTIDSVSSTLNASRDAVNTINGNGLTGSTHSNANGDGISWTSALAPSVAGEFITYDLGANYDLSSVTIWNWNTSNTLSAGANSVTISVASASGGALTSLGNFTLAQAPGVDTYAGQVLDLSSFAAADDAAVLQVSINSNYGFAAGSNTVVGLAEVRFDGVAIPEPSAFALLGLSALGLLARRRRA